MRAESAPEGLFLSVNMMIREPAVRRAIAFFDGQNLYRHAKDAFGHHHPNYHPVKLFDAICADKGWENRGVRFYTGVPAARYDEMWHGYWTNRLLAMRREGIAIESRPLRYRAHTTEHTDGSVEATYIPQEKGIDLRLGLDVVRLARVNQLDVAVIFSQDQDLAEVVGDVREIARDGRRWIKVVSAYPAGSRATAGRGIDGTDWYPIDEDSYNACLDMRDYRPKKFRGRRTEIA